jgi:hypothetical protein
MSARAAPHGAAALWQLAARFASRHEPKYLSLIPIRSAVIPLAVSLFENSRRIDGIGHSAGLSHRAALICKARNHI